MAEPKRQTRIPLAQRPITPDASSIDIGSAPPRLAGLSKAPLSRPPSRQQWKPPGAAEGIPKHPKYQSLGRESSNTSTIAHRFSSAIPMRLFPGKIQSTAPVAEEKSPRPQTPTSIIKTVLGAAWWGATDIPFHDTMRALNPDVDRSPAQINERDGSKLVIVLLNTYGRKKEFTYPVPIDWSDSGRVIALNRWRAATFKHYLGEPPDTCRVQPHASEYAFVTEEYEKLEKEPRESHAQTETELPSWANIARGFNAKFEGKKLEGDLTPRPRVTREQLRARYLGPLNKSGEKITELCSDEESTVDSASVARSSSASNESSTATTWSGLVGSNRDSNISKSASNSSLPRFPRILSRPEPGQQSSPSEQKPKPRISRIPRLSSMVASGEGSSRDAPTEYLDRVLPHRELKLPCCTDTGICSQLQS